MDTELVTGSVSDTKGGGESRRPSLSYGEQFELLCPYYLSLGLSYEDYWDGDCEKAKYVRKAYELHKEKRNTELWMQGFYIYEALLDVSPVFNALSKRKEPFPYSDAPVPVTAEREKQKKEEDKQKRLEAGKRAMRVMMAEFNAKFKKDKERRNDDGQ